MELFQSYFMVLDFLSHRNIVKKVYKQYVFSIISYNLRRENNCCSIFLDVQYGRLGTILLIITAIVIIGYHLIDVNRNMFFLRGKNYVLLTFIYINNIINIWFHLFALSVSYFTCLICVFYLIFFRYLSSYFHLNWHDSWIPMDKLLLIRKV